MTFGTYTRGDWMNHRPIDNPFKIIGTHDISYYQGIDTQLTLNPDGTISGGSVDWSVPAHYAYVATFGDGAAIVARNAATPFSEAGVAATGASTLEYGPYGGQTSFTFATKYMNDGSFWFDLDGNGAYETHGAETGSGIALDLDFNGSYETPMVDFF